MTIVSVGATYRSAPAELLERLTVAELETPPLLRALHALPAIREVLVLPTCNRIEVYVSASGSSAEVAADVAAVFGARADILPDELRGLLTTRRNTPAVTHLFRVACGLDSMVVGEDQIVAQIRRAAQAADSAVTLGPVLTRLVDAALRASKRVRTATLSGQPSRSLAHAGLERCRAELGTLAGRTVLLIGSGTVGGLAGELLRHEGAGRILVSSRNAANAGRVAAAIGAEIVPRQWLAQTLASCDVVIVAVRATRAVLSADTVRLARAGAGDRRLVVLDLGLPRNVDPACRQVPGVTLVDIDDLGRDLAGRADDAGRAARATAEQLVAEEVDEYLRCRHEAAAGPLIRALHVHARDVVEGELTRLHRRLPNLSERERAETAAAIRRVVGKLLHEPTTRAKELTTTPNGTGYLEALSHLFNLNPAGADA